MLVAQVENFPIIITSIFFKKNSNFNNQTLIEKLKEKMLLICIIKENTTYSQVICTDNIFTQW